METTRESHDASPPRTARRPSRGPNAQLIALAKRRKRYLDALELMEEPIADAVHASRLKGASWEWIGRTLDMHKDTARRTYQTSSVEAGGPTPRVQRCGLQQAPGGWCRNGVAGMVERAGGGPGMYICKPHGDEGVASGKYVWREAPDRP